MEWLYFLIMVLFLISIVLMIKLILLKKSIKKLSKLIEKRVERKENQLLYVDSQDQDMKNIAKTLNKELGEIQKERMKYQKGDRELLNAITNITHDLRTPLTAMKGYMDLCEREEMSEEMAKYLNVIKGRCEKLEDLTTELFKYTLIESTQDEIKYEIVDIASVLEECIVDFYAVMREKMLNPKVKMTNIKIQRNLGRKELMTIFSNIISNAVKYSEGEFCVTLYDDGTIQFSNFTTALDEVSVGKLFDRFFTVNSTHNSTGLGLSIAKRLVVKMNGTIEAKYENKNLILTIKF